MTDEIKKCDNRANLSEEAKDFLALVFDPWSNNSALGYAIRAMKNSDLSEEVIQEVVGEMNWLFDAMDLKEAAQTYETGNY